MELYFVTFGSMDSFARQLEGLFEDLDEVENGEKWLQVLAYAMSQKTARHWKDNPKLRVIFYGECVENIEPLFSDKFSSCFSEYSQYRN